MKAVQISEPFKIGTVELEKPSCSEGEVLLKICYCGFCGSDLNSFRGGNAMAKMPLIPGHEIGAVIEQTGKLVPDSLKLGMVVTVNPYTNCGKCASCRGRRYNACEHNETLGVQRDGAMREYICLPWEKVIPAEGISVRDCALIEPMSVGFHAVARAGVSDNEFVMVIGCGMVGLGAVVRAALRGARVIAVDIDDCKLQLAKRLGAEFGINSSSEDVQQRVREITDGLMADVVIEAVGNKVTYVLAVDCVAFTGRIACIGYAKTEVSFNTGLFVKKELDIRGSRNALPEDFRSVIRYISSGKCPVEELISAVVKPEQTQEAMDNWMKDPGKVFRILVSFLD